MAGRSAILAVHSEMLSPQPESVLPPKAERTQEHERLATDAKRATNWKRWGTFGSLEIEVGPKSAPFGPWLDCFDLIPQFITDGSVLT